jgi:hypothetical protein
MDNFIGVIPMLIKSLKNIAKGGLLTLATVTAAHATVLTAPALNSEGSQHFHCTIANLSTKPLLVQKVEFIDGDSGAVMYDSGEFTLDPGASTSTIGSDSYNGYCRFTFKGSAKKVRAGMNLHNAAGDQVVAYYPAT